MGASRSKPGTNAVTPEELFMTAYPKLAAWINRQINDDATAHAIAFKAFVRLLSRWTRVESRDDYLHAAAARLIRDHCRKAKTKVKRNRDRRAPTAACAG